MEADKYLRAGRGEVSSKESTSKPRTEVTGKDNKEKRGYQITLRRVKIKKGLEKELQIVRLIFIPTSHYLKVSILNSCGHTGSRVYFCRVLLLGIFKGARRKISNRGDRRDNTLS